MTQRSHLKFFLAATALLLIPGSAISQTKHSTIRHHRVEDPADAKITQAEAAIEKQDYAAAEPLLKSYLEAHPDDYAGWYDLGFTYQASGRHEESIAAYRKSVSLRADVFESNLNLGLELANSSQPEAEQYLRAATKLKPGSNPSQGMKRAWMSLGRVLEPGKPQEAVQAFQNAAAADPADAEPHLLAGAIFEKQQQLADAAREYEQAISVDPNSADVLTSSANFYMRSRRFAEAEPLLRKLATLHPENAGAHIQLGRMLALLGRRDEAISEIENGLKLDPSDTKAQRDLADLYGDAGKFAEAQALYTRLLQSYPREAELHYGLGRTLLKQKKYADAEKELSQAAQLQPDMGAAYADLAIAANENKDYALAIRATDLRAKYMPETPMSYFLRATAYDHLHDPKRAATYYHQFLEMAGGKYPDQEWQARHRLIAIEPKK